MRRFALIIFASAALLSCEKENNDLVIENVIGKWRLVKGYDIMDGGYYNVPRKYQRYEEYTKSNIRIQSELDGKEISKCAYSATNDTVTIFGKENNGDEWSFKYAYWFQHDTLAVKHDGGFEFYNEYFIRAK